MGKTPSQKLKICHSCEHLNKPLFGSPKCEVCGCIVRLKVIRDKAECPMGKW